MRLLDTHPERLVVVLGGAGFVGRHTCRALAAKGFTVHALGHGNWSESERSAWGVAKWTQTDITLAALQNLTLPCAPDAVLQCAGSGAVSYTYQSPRDDFTRAVQTTADVLEWARLHGGGSCRVVVVSSAAVYGDQGEVDLSESSTRSPISPYGFHKVAAEMLCDSYSRFFAVPVSVVRLFSVYGEGLRKQLLWDASNKFAAGAGSFFGTGHEMRDWIHVDDAADLLAIASTVPQARYEIYNGGHIQATTLEVLRLLASASGCSAEPLFNGQTHIGNPRRLTADCNHARRQLGWTPTIGLEQGLLRYAQWFESLL